MPRHSQLIPALVLGLAACAASAAQGHEFWLAPSNYHPAKGETVNVTVFVGTGFRGELKPYAAPRVVRLFAKAATAEDLRAHSVNGDDVFARWTAKDAGGAIVAYESNFVSIELGATEFDRYLKLEGLDGPLAQRAKLAAALPGRERYARCPKTWIAGTDPKRVTAPAGLTLELVPKSDPTESGPLELELLYRGEPLAGALVRAWNHKLSIAMRPTNGATRDSVGPAASARTDANGRVKLPIARSGEWLVSAVHMVPSRDPRNSDWESFWASLTFARPERRRE